MPSRFPQDDRPQLLDAPQGVGAEGLKPIQPLAEQLGQTRLGAVNAEAAMEFAQFVGAEIGGIGALALAGGGAGVVAPVAHALQKPGVGDEYELGGSQGVEKPEPCGSQAGEAPQAGDQPTWKPERDGEPAAKGHGPRGG